jgi:hypothetical protein
VLKFLSQGGKQAIITSYEHLADAIDGVAGTRILPDRLSTELELVAPSEVTLRGR